ncbi:MAG: hypothetical protein J7641_01780 [Cyanobacteria bacterium SID2]|nr:hypothetical protein [Cyanobacteria bacterium SID2]MBP0003078.1 hypothetical protein [Cyanobacteria bacterium SBC]
MKDDQYRLSQNARLATRANRERDRLREVSGFSTVTARTLDDCTAALPNFSQQPLGFPLH